MNNEEIPQVTIEENNTPQPKESRKIFILIGLTAVIAVAIFFIFFNTKSERVVMENTDSVNTVATDTAVKIPPVELLPNEENVNKCIRSGDLVPPQPCKYDIASGVVAPGVTAYFGADDSAQDGTTRGYLYFQKNGALISEIPSFTTGNNAYYMGHVVYVQYVNNKAITVEWACGEVSNCYAFLANGTWRQPNDFIHDWLEESSHYKQYYTENPEYVVYTVSVTPDNFVFAEHVYWEDEAGPQLTNNTDLDRYDTKGAYQFVFDHNLNFQKVVYKKY